MSYTVALEARGRILVVTIDGRIAYGDEERQRADRLKQELAHHAERGGDLVLFDFSRATLMYTSSIEFVVTPMLEARARGRIAAICPTNHRLRRVLPHLVDWFDSESEAIGFLESDDALVNPAQYDHVLWRSIGEEVGPKECKNEDCDRLRVNHSVFCKRHHYRMLMRSDYIEP